MLVTLLPIAILLIVFLLISLAKDYYYNYACFYYNKRYKLSLHL